MKNIGVFLSENFQFLEMKFSMYLNRHVFIMFTLLLLNMTCLVLANSVDPDQLASEEAN